MGDPTIKVSDPLEEEIDNRNVEMEIDDMEVEEILKKLEDFDVKLDEADRKLEEFRVILGLKKWEPKKPAKEEVPSTKKEKKDKQPLKEKEPHKKKARIQGPIYRPTSERPTVREVPTWDPMDICDD